MKKVIDNLYGAKGGINKSRANEVWSALVVSVTTTQKRALTSVVKGTIVYDTTLKKLCVYTAEAGGSSTGWETVTSVLE